ncbi:MAG: hypothetical protein HY922_00920 [Elusimicrobia bacterium]|nr:hypothetical protein [Elusimicrobiota bacterium]
MVLLFSAFGFFCLLEQVIILREVSFLFLGHELSLGLSLCGWIFWSGVGSFNLKPRRPLAPLAACVCAAPLTLLLARAAALALPAGSIPGLFAILAFSAALTAPAGLCAGAFSSAAMGADQRAGVRFFIFEALGACLGGLAYTFLIAGKLAPMTALCAAGAGVLLAEAVSLRKEGWLARAVLWVACAAALALGLVFDGSSRALRYQRYELRSETETPYARIAIASLKKGQSLVLEDGFVSGEYPEPASNEETAHLPLLAHPKPRDVFVLGTPGLLALPEILKHKPASVIAAELDGRKAGLILDLLSLKDVKTVTTDPRHVLRGGEKFDLILQTVPEPVNAAANRFFTLEFFKEAKAALRPGGVLAFSLPASENYLAPEEAYLAASVLKTAQEAFPFVETVPGRRMLVLVSDNKLDISPATFGARYNSRKLKNKTVIPSAFPFILHPERMQWLRRSLADVRRVSLNNDLDPISYFLTWRVWLSKFVSPAYLLGAAACAMAVLWALGALLVRWRIWVGRPDLMAVFSMGFWGMALEIALLLLAQSALGALHWQLGLLFAAFMLGLALGSAAFSFVNGRRWVILALLLAAAAASAALSRRAEAIVLLEGGRGLAVFLALQCAAGFLVGGVFPPAAGLKCSPPARLYACDLWGACLGGALTASMLVPLLGLKTTILAASLPCAAAALLSLPRLLAPPAP